MELNDNKAALLKSMEDYFGADSRRIAHARRVMEYAEQLLPGEGGDRSVVIAAAVLHDIGIHKAEERHGSTSGRYQELEGPPIAREILERLHYPRQEIDEICEIIGHHHSPGKIATVNFRILYDADWLVNLQEEHASSSRDKLSTIIDRVFLTRSGKALAHQAYLKDDA